MMRQTFDETTDPSFGAKHLPLLRAEMAKQGLEPVGGGPQALDRLIRSEISLWSQVVTRGKIVIE